MGIKHAVIVFLFFASLFVLFFSPVLFSSRILPSDGQMASFHSPVELWTSYLWGGFPAAADPQYQSWYPLCRLLRLFPNGFNIFMTLAYVLASCFTYGYAFSLTGSRFSALVAGTTFGMSGFMMAHLGHSAMIQATLWFPLVMWALEELRGRLSIPWFVVAVLASAANLLGGHPQVFAYTWMLGLTYAVCLGRDARDGWLRYVGTSLAVVAMSCCVAAIQLVPTFEFSLLSLRNKLTFAEFVSFSLPPKQLIQLLFPALFGVPHSPHHVPYFGLFNSQELTGYIGILPLMLAAVGAWVFRRNRVALFWVVIAPTALLLAMGDATPLARLLYRVPVINSFRAPARHFMEFSFALSILAGFGAHAVLGAKTSGRLLRNVVVGTCVIGTASAAVIYAFYDQLRAKAGRLNIELGPAVTNPAVFVPLILFACSIAAFVFWTRLPGRRYRQVILWVAVLVNLGAFGWFYEWRYVAIDKAVIHTPFMAKHKRLLDNTRQRVLALGVGGQPDMFRLHRLESVGGYGPLMVKRFAELSGATTYGTIAPESLEDTNRSIDLLAVRYIFRPASSQPAQRLTTESHGITWAGDDLGIHLGRGCNNTFPSRQTLVLPQPVAANRAAIVTKMSCSTEVHDNQPVLELSLIAEEGSSEKLILMSGRDISEYAYDHPAVRGVMKHQRAKTFASWPVRHNGGGEWTARSYLASFAIPRATYKAIDLRWLQAPAVIDVDKISLIDEADGSTQVVQREDRFEDFETVEGVTVSRNNRAHPRVWLASEVISAEPHQILAIITKSQPAPDGMAYDLRRTAFVEEPIDFRVEDPDSKGTVTVTHMTGTHIEIQSSSRTPAFLVLSEVHYPGWKASIDGVQAHIFRTDYALRGIALPAGNHMVRLDFQPVSLYVGATISILTLLGILASSALHLTGRRRSARSHQRERGHPGSDNSVVESRCLAQ